MVATNDRWFPIDTIYRSTDGGASWEDVGASAKLDITASPYLAWGGTPKFGWWIGSIAIDPFNGNRAMYGTGATVFGTSDLTAADSGQPTTWSSAAATGIEETAVNDLLVPAAGSCRLISAVGDLGGFCHTSLSTSPSGGMISPIVSTGTSIAEAGQVPLDVAMVAWGGGDFSTDGGVTWTAMTLPAGDPDGAGTVALSADGSALVWTPEDNSWAPQAAAPVYSTDKGKTWTDVSGLAAGVAVVADPVNPKVFYAFDQSAGTLYASADGGATFTAETARPGHRDAASEGTNSLSLLHTVQGSTGDLWLTGGDGSLYHSTDGGKTFAKDASVGTVATVGFGKAAPGARGYPAIYLTGIVGGVQGIFRSADGGANWTRINTDAQQWGWIGQSITGDPDVYGLVYVGTNGRGIEYANTANVESIISMPHPGEKCLRACLRITNSAELWELSGGGSVRQSRLDPFGGRSPLLQFDTAAFKEFQDTLSQDLNDFPRASRSQARGSTQSTSRNGVRSSWLLLRLGGRFLLQLGEQLLEVLPLAERVEGTLGAILVDVAEAGVDGLSQQGHRLVGVGLSLGGRHARALLPGETRERGVGAGDGESRHSLPCSRSPSESLSACRTSAAAPAGSPRARRARPRPTSDRTRVGG